MRVAGLTVFHQALMYGSKAAKAEGLVSSAATQHSKLIGRNKYVHERVTHCVIPSHRDAYVAAAEKYYRAIIERGDELGGIKLTGSWEVVVGSVGEFTHILEYEGYKGFDSTARALRTDQVSSQLGDWGRIELIHVDQKMKSLYNDMLPHLTSREHQIMSEFSFWPSSPPHDSGFPDGGIFEMRSYQLVPGKLLEWEGAWRRGLEARRRFVVRFPTLYTGRHSDARLLATCRSILRAGRAIARGPSHMAVPVSHISFERPSSLNIATVTWRRERRPESKLGQSEDGAIPSER